MRGSLRADALGMTETGKGVKNRHNFGYALCAACGGEQRIGTAAAKESPRSSHSEKPKATEGAASLREQPRKRRWGGLKSGGASRVAGV